MKTVLLALIALNLIGSSPQPLREGWAWQVSSRDPKTPKLIYIESGLPGISIADANDPKFFRQYVAKYIDHPIPRLFIRVYRDEIKIRTLDDSSWITINRKDVIDIRWQKKGKT